MCDPCTVDRPRRNRHGRGGCQWNWSHTYMHICTYICTLHMADARLFWLKARPYARCEVPDKKAAECVFGKALRSS